MKRSNPVDYKDSTFQEELKDTYSDGAKCGTCGRYPIFENRKWFTTEQAAKYLGISVGSLRNRTSNGSIIFHKLPDSRLNRYLRHELDGLLLQNRRGPTDGF